jgi:hypothetical protein
MRLFICTWLSFLVLAGCAPVDPSTSLASGSYVSSVRAVHRDGAYTVAWTEWTGQEAVGKLATLESGCAPSGEPREIFRVPGLVVEGTVVTYPVLIGLDVRGTRAAFLTQPASSATDPATLWIVDGTVRSVPLGHMNHAAVTLGDREVEVASSLQDESWGSMLEVARVDLETLEVTSRRTSGIESFVEPGFGHEGRVAFARDRIVELGESDERTTTPLSFAFGRREIEGLGSSDEALGVATEDGDRSELFEVTRRGALLSHRRFPGPRARARPFDAGGIAAAWYEVDGSDANERRRAILYTPPLALEARVVAALDERAVMLEQDGIHSTLDGAFDGVGEVLLAYTKASGSWDAERLFQPSQLRARCFAADGSDLPVSSQVLASRPPVRGPTTCEPDGYELSHPFYERPDGSFSLWIAGEADVTTTCSAFEANDAMVRFRADRAGTYGFTAHGGFMGGLEVRTACSEPATAVACEADLSYHSPEPFSTPIEIQVPLEANQTIWLVLEAFGATEVTANPPREPGPRCDVESDCAIGSACLAGHCSAITAPVLESARVYFHESVSSGGSNDSRIMVQATGSDAGRDVTTILVWPEGDPNPITLFASATSTEFRLKARSSDEPIPRTGNVLVALEDSTGLRSDVLTVPLEPAPVVGDNGLCDLDQVENVCADGLMCSTIPGGASALCRFGGF